MKPRPTITTKTTNSSQLPKHTHSFWCVSHSPLPQLSTLNTGGGEFVCIFSYNSIPQSNWYWTQEMIVWTASQVTEREQFPLKTKPSSDTHELITHKRGNINIKQTHAKMFTFLVHKETDILYIIYTTTIWEINMVICNLYHKDAHTVRFSNLTLGNIS